MALTQAKRCSWLAVLGVLALCLAVTDAFAAKKAKKAPPAPAPVEETAEADDPLEFLNRAIYGFNYVIDGLILRPVTHIYRGIVPDKGREMVSNAIENIYTPVTFANSVLQADPQNSFSSLWRFMINSTVGIGGLFDVASEAGLKARKTDFGQTLAIYGVGPGPYTVLPIIGPSNTRDSIGRIADAFMNPFNYISDGATAGIWTATAIVKRDENMGLIDGVYRDSLDPYSTFRSLYTQKRASDVRRAKEARDKALGMCVDG